MKKLAALSFVLLFAVSSEAQIKKAYERVKQVVTGSAQISQLHYFPQQWEVDLTFGYRLQNLDITVKSATATISKANQKASTIESVLQLGLLDSLFAELEWDYVIATKTDYSEPANQGSTKFLGPRDPVISLNYRLLDASSFKFDTRLGYQPSLGDEKDADTTNDGNALAGGQAFVVGVKAIVLATESSQLAANVVLKNIGESTEVDQMSNQTSTVEAHNQLNFEISTLTKLTNQMFFGIQLDFISIDAYGRTGFLNSNTGATKGQVLNFIGKYELTPDNLITAEIGYILDYQGEVLNFDYNAEGYSAALAYTVRF